MSLESLMLEKWFCYRFVPEPVMLAERKGFFNVVRRIYKADYGIRVNDCEPTYHVNKLKIFREREAGPQLLHVPSVA